MFLHYPVWNLEFFGGGFLIAVIAVIHVYVAHFAIGGGLFLVLTEIKGIREDSPAILQFTKRHTTFFLLLTMVFGAITGVAIWFTISLLNPAATSFLIHTYVFGWAIEWVFFTGEIVALFVYFYTFDTMEKKAHLRVGWLYFIFGWLSLFVINGILSFMLTPGKWLVSHHFWDGFFNPTFWPSLIFRTCMAFMLAGLFGFITSVFIAEQNFRDKMTRYCAGWLIMPLCLLLLSGWWYAQALPASQKAMIFARSPEIIPFLKAFFYISPVIFVIGIMMAIRLPQPFKKILAFGLLAIGLAYMGSFEWIREAGRRPYIIYGHMFSNSALVEDQKAILKTGVLKSARWAKIKDITPSNQIKAGQEIFRLLCMSCHSIGGPMNDIRALTRKYPHLGIKAMLVGLGKINDYMPPFLGNTPERDALAAYLAQRLHRKKERALPLPPSKSLPLKISTFDPQKDEYILLAWANKGMHFVSDSDRYFSLAAPGNTIMAQLIKRGETPEMVTENVVLTYRIESGFSTPSRQVAFWQFSPALMGRRIPADTGLSGNKTNGKLIFDDALGAHIARKVPLIPYPDNTGFHPYPLVTIEAKDPSSGETLATIQFTAPVSTEMGCRNCHGGPWRKADRAGISDPTAADILTVHDRINRTHLGQTVQSGQPQRCQACHTDADAESDKQDLKALNLSAAMHGFHANVMPETDSQTCGLCHPSGRGTFTKGLRGIHSELEFECTNCHGSMTAHALSLLKAERMAGKKSADRLITHLGPGSDLPINEISPRKPWVNLPDCLNCHVDFDPPENDTSFNQWTETESDLYRMRTGDGGIMCAACHGAPHAIYPATNIFGNNRDNIPPMQYQKNPYPMGADEGCRVCHTIDMQEETHHPNSLAMFRNTR